jgi:hypothetical protein
LRQYSQIINLSTGKSDFAQRILQLALNRTGKSFNGTSDIPSTTTSVKPMVTTEDPVKMVEKISNMQDDINMMNNILMENADKESMIGKPKLSSKELERTKQMLEKDVRQYNNDLQLLSLLLGRPINPNEVSKLTQNIPNSLGKGNNIPSSKSITTSKFTTRTTQRPTTTTTTSTTTTTLKPTTTTTLPQLNRLTEQEIKLLEALNRVQSTNAVTTTRKTTVRTTKRPLQLPPLGGRSQEAVLAELLKQRGIGPLNNQIPVDQLLEQLSGNTNQRPPTIRPLLTTTQFTPFAALPNSPPRRQPRPLLDGLAWLWRQWQETAPTQRPRSPSFPSAPSSTSLDTSQENRSPLPPPPGLGLLAFGSGAPSFGASAPATGDDISNLNQPIPQSGLLNAAIGVTRAVTSFLGAAFAGVTRGLQTAFASGAGLNNGNDQPAANFYSFSGR